MKDLSKLSGASVSDQTVKVSSRETDEESVTEYTITLHPCGAKIQLEASEDSNTAWILTIETPKAARRKGHMTALVRWLLETKLFDTISIGTLSRDGKKFMPVWNREADKLGITITESFMTPAQKLVSAISSGNRTEAVKAFTSAIADKREVALDVEKIRLTSKVYNGAGKASS